MQLRKHLNVRGSGLATTTSMPCSTAEGISSSLLITQLYIAPNVLFLLDQQSVDQWRHHILRQMIQELADRIYSFLARWASSDHNTTPALRDRWRFVNEVRKIVSLNFFLDCCEQDGFLHGRTLWWCAEEIGSRSLARHSGDFPASVTNVYRYACRLARIYSCTNRHDNFT
jgi:hypothetical protein